jgi:hypothetical protein
MRAETNASEEAAQMSDDSIHTAGEFTDSEEPESESEEIEEFNSSSSFFTSSRTQVPPPTPKPDSVEEHGRAYLAPLFQKVKDNDGPSADEASGSRMYCRKNSFGIN